MGNESNNFLNEGSDKGRLDSLIWECLDKTGLSDSKDVGYHYQVIETALVKSYLQGVDAVDASIDAVVDACVVAIADGLQ
ncbi:MAG: hypothetical protein LBP28_05680 [Coriobacteriales bacterium]|jgi:hypothetical protein|nr:hypothetical protein [Coriobacteriales bacterium]